MSKQFEIRCVREGPLNRVFVDGVELDPKDSRKVYDHSPAGFDWGYPGSGPSQTALAICWHIFQNTNATFALYRDFKDRFVSKWKQDLIEATIRIEDFYET